MLSDLPGQGPPTESWTATPAAVTIGVSLKMYFGYEQTVAWCESVREIGLSHPAVVDGSVELFVIPAYPVLAMAKQVFAGTSIGLGAQNLHWEDVGPFTGEVSGSMLAELGCRYVEVGHAERRQLFGETDYIVAAKTEAALRNGLIPVLCIGELTRRAPEKATRSCVDQIEAALTRSKATVGGRIIVAYEPIWAIGAPEPAAPEHIKTVCVGLRAALQTKTGFESTVIYGGAAGPGLMTMLQGSVEGLFLGRSVHQPAALAAVLREVKSPNQESIRRRY